MTLSSSRLEASDDQREALGAFNLFLASRDQQVFVLSGAAGTGKTTLLGQMLGAVARTNARPHLSALTGRAATIARMRTGIEASTLHSYLYRFDARSSKVIDGLPRLIFSLRNPADEVASVLFVDEASMLGSSVQGESATMSFGSGNLAADLIEYMFTRDGSPIGNSKLVLVGDPFQLRPVGDDDSVVFNSEGWNGLTLATLGRPLATGRVELTTVHRQGQGGVLELATRYRDALISGDHRTTPRPPPDDPEVLARETAGGSLVPWAEEVAADHRSQVVITYTNAGATVWNRLVRQARWRDPDLQVRESDLLATTRRDPRTGLDNGEILEVRSAAQSVRAITHLGRTVRLRPVSVKSMMTEQRHDALLDDNALASDERTMSRDDSQVLWVDFTQRHRELRQGTPEFWDAAYRDPMLNPIVAKYGYALTGHKAQGGQWDRVIVDFNLLPVAPDSEETFRWAYTAITRARQQLVLIDAPYRSPFSRLASGDSVGKTRGVARDSSDPPTDVRRSRAEMAVEAWARAQGFEVKVISTKDYNTRFETTDGIGSAVFDVYFNADGAVTKRLAVRPDAETTGNLMPPLALIERASFEGMPRPVDPHIDIELRRIEQALREAGVSVSFRQAQEWTVELEIEQPGDAGVLRLNFRKSGVFSARNWKRPPSDDLQRRVDDAMDALARG